MLTKEQVLREYGLPPEHVLGVDWFVVEDRADGGVLIKPQKPVEHITLKAVITSNGSFFDTLI